MLTILNRAQTQFWPTAVLAVGLAGPVHAQQVDLNGFADMRLVRPSDQQSGFNGGLGKLQFDGGRKPGVDFQVAQIIADVKAQATPDLGFLGTFRYMQNQKTAFDILESYVRYRPVTTDAVRWSVRGGAFFPPVSLENDGLAWTNPDMLTDSAINSWIGEEVKVGGVEATYQRRFGDHEVSATAAVFGWNDTSGTLLSFRGWALHGTTLGASTSYDLPPLSNFIGHLQATDTYPILELDNRPGYYGRLDWRPPTSVRFNATYYDNGGNRIDVNRLQWAWETRFLNLGAVWQPDEATRISAQAMNGQTLMGFRMEPLGVWVDLDFRSAYLLAQRRIGGGTISGRIDSFSIHDRSLRQLDDNSEHGWALTGAWRHPLAPHADLVLEALHVTSHRPARVLAHEDPVQDQTVLQSALRLSF